MQVKVGGTLNKLKKDEDEKKIKITMMSSFVASPSHLPKPVTEVLAYIVHIFFILRFILNLFTNCKA